MRSRAEKKPSKKMKRGNVPWDPPATQGIHENPGHQGRMPGTSSTPMFSLSPAPRWDSPAAGVEEVATSKKAWGAHNPCYLCCEVGHTASAHGLRPQWSQADTDRWTRTQAMWTCVRGALQLGQSPQKIARDAGLPASRVQGRSDKQILENVLVWKIGLPL